MKRLSNILYYVAMTVYFVHLFRDDKVSAAIAAFALMAVCASWVFKDRVICPNTFFVFAWFDFWVGIYFDRKNRVFYFFHVPMFGIKYHL